MEEKSRKKLQKEKLTVIASFGTRYRLKTRDAENSCGRRKRRDARFSRKETETGAKTGVSRRSRRDNPVTRLSSYPETIVDQHLRITTVFTVHIGTRALSGPPPDCRVKQARAAYLFNEFPVSFVFPSFVYGCLFLPSTWNDRAP